MHAACGREARSTGSAPPPRRRRCLLPACCSPPTFLCCSAAPQIRFVLLLSRQGKVRLAKWYTTLSQKERAKITKEVREL